MILESASIPGVSAPFSVYPKCRMLTLSGFLQKETANGPGQEYSGSSFTPFFRCESKLGNRRHSQVRPFFELPAQRTTSRPAEYRMRGHLLSLHGKNRQRGTGEFTGTREECVDFLSMKPIPSPVARIRHVQAGGCGHEGPDGHNSICFIDPLKPVRSRLSLCATGRTHFFQKGVS